MSIRKIFKHEEEPQTREIVFIPPTPSKKECQN